MGTRKLYWYKDKPKVYTYNMTMVAALMAQDGMTFVSDGLVNDFDGNTIEDKQVKIFELSPLAVLLPANGASDNMETIMSTLKGLYEHGGVVNINDVTIRFAEYCNQYVAMTPMERVPLFTLGGFNLLPDGSHEPKIYLIQCNGEKWEVFETRGEDSFVAQGAKGELIRKFLAEGFQKATSKTTHQRNLLALRALALAEKESPEYVGGQTALWNLKPGLPIRKFPQSEISKLRIGL